MTESQTLNAVNEKLVIFFAVLFFLAIFFRNQILKLKNFILKVNKI